MMIGRLNSSYAVSKNQAAFGTAKPKAPGTIGNNLGLSQERIQQIAQQTKVGFQEALVETWKSSVKLDQAIGIKPQTFTEFLRPNATQKK